jgi:hypothetical protein
MPGKCSPELESVSAKLPDRHPDFIIAEIEVWIEDGPYSYLRTPDGTVFPVEKCTLHTQEDHDKMCEAGVYD